MAAYQGYKPHSYQQTSSRRSTFGSRGGQKLPPQLGMHVVNQTIPGSYQGIAQHVAAGYAGAPNLAGRAAANQYGPPDPWLSHIYARQAAAAKGDSGGNDGGSTGNAYLDALRDNINTQIANAKANALAQKKDLLLGFGSQELARKILGKNYNPAWIATISDNPDTSFSTLARENYGYRTNQGVTRENLNVGNLWYSGAHGMALQNLARTHLGNIDTATKQVQGQISSIDQSLLQLIAQLQGQLIQASQPQQT